MKVIFRRVVISVFFVLLLLPTVSSQQQSPGPANPLEKLAWLEGKWSVKATVPGGGAMYRESFYEWSNNHKALRYWSFATPDGGARAPYVDGWYFWDPVDKKIRFAYVDPGSLYEGEVRIEGNTFDHTFTGRHENGRTSRWRFTLTNNGDGTMPTHIYSEKDGAWQEFVSLTYQKQK